MAEKKAGKAGLSVKRTKGASTEVVQSCKVVPAPDTNKPLRAGKAETLPGGYDGATEGPQVKAQLAGSRKTSHPAPDTKPPSVFPLNEVDMLKVEVAKLEEDLKNKQFEVNDAKWTIKGLEKSIAELVGDDQLTSRQKRDKLRHTLDVMKKCGCAECKAVVKIIEEGEHDG